jgi:hypothetical protein
LNYFIEKRVSIVDYTIWLTSGDSSRLSFQISMQYIIIGRFLIRKPPTISMIFVYNDRQAQLSFIINGITKGEFVAHPLHPRLT